MWYLTHHSCDPSVRYLVQICWEPPRLPNRLLREPTPFTFQHDYRWQPSLGDRIPLLIAASTPDGSVWRWLTADDASAHSVIDWWNLARGQFSIDWRSCSTAMFRVQALHPLPGPTTESLSSLGPFLKTVIPPDCLQTPYLPVRFKKPAEPLTVTERAGSSISRHWPTRLSGLISLTQDRLT